MSNETTYKVTYSVYSFFFRQSFQFTKELKATTPELAKAQCKILNPLAEDIYVESKFELDDPKKS